MEFERDKKKIISNPETKFFASKLHWPESTNTCPTFFFVGLLKINDQDAADEEQLQVEPVSFQLLSFA